MCDISDSVLTKEEPDFVDITDNTEDTNTLNVSLSTSSANTDETNHILYSNQGSNNSGLHQYYIAD